VRQASTASSFCNAVSVLVKNDPLPRQARDEHQRKLTPKVARRFFRRRLDALSASPATTAKGRTAEVSSFSLALFKEGWAWPSAEEMGAAGTGLIGRQVCVLGMGCGTVVDFKQNFGRGASHHEIDFDEDAACVVGEGCTGERRLCVKLKRKTNTDPEKKEWLILPVATARNSTSSNGGGGDDNSRNASDAARTETVVSASRTGSTSLIESFAALPDADAPTPQQPFGNGEALTPGGGGGPGTPTALVRSISAASSVGNGNGNGNGNGGMIGAPPSPLANGGSGPSPQSRLSRSGSLNGRQAGGGGTALSEWRMPGACCAMLCDVL
jgi:hypothetical protein